MGQKNIFPALSACLAIMESRERGKGTYFFPLLPSKRYAISLIISQNFPIRPPAKCLKFNSPTAHPLASFFHYFFFFCAVLLHLSRCIPSSTPSLCFSLSVCLFFCLSFPAFLSPCIEKCSCQSYLSAFLTVCLSV